MKKKLIKLSIASVFTIILIFILHGICIKQNLQFGNFERNFKNVEFRKINEIPLPCDANNFIGINKGVIYFTSKKLDEIFKYDIKSEKFSSKITNHKNHNSNIVGDSLFTFDPSRRKTYVYDTKTLNLLYETDLNVGFDRALAVDYKTILLRSATDRYTKTIFSVYNIKNNQNKILKIQLSDSIEVDGGLRTDGYFSHKDSLIIFTQYKKGNFYKLNNKLNRIQRFRTIDNIQKVEGVKLSPDSTYYFEKPVLNVNLLTSVTEDKVFIVSFVKGNSDKLNEFTKYRMIDVYNTITGKYIESYYLPNNGIEKAIDFYVDKNKIFLLYDNKIAIYDIY